MTRKGTPNDALLREEALSARLEQLKASVIAWASERDLWHDSIFRPAFEHRDEAPRESEVLYLCTDGPLCSMFSPNHEDWDRLNEEFLQLLADHGFECELEDHVTLNIFPTDPIAVADYLKLQRWQWIQRLAERRLYDLHSEVFEYVAADPGALNRLHWRQFEEFLDSVFRNQGFRTELGPGRNDGGVDLRLYQSESIPEIVTVVQAKRWKKPIAFQEVAALTTAAQVEGAPQALFATTSRYQPAARKFALTTQSRLDFPTLELAGPEQFQEWCAEIAKRLSDYFLAGAAPVPPVALGRSPTELTGKIVVAHWGYNTIRNSFAVIEADFPHEVILRPIGKRAVSGDGQRGTEIAEMTASISSSAPKHVLAFKRHSEWSDQPIFWGDRMLFTLWDGRPQLFDHCD